MNAGYAVEKGGFSRTIGTDKGDDFPFLDIQIQLIQSARRPPKSMLRPFTSSIGAIYLQILFFVVL
jgi:hypothetical protein